MSRQIIALPFGGGVDEMSPPLNVKPGRLIAALNHEVVDNGYARIDGYERFDGRLSPTDAPFWLLGTALDVALAAGDILVGADSGAEATLLTAATVETTQLGIFDLTGGFVVGEVIEVGGMAVGTVALAELAGGGDSPDAAEAGFGLARRALARGDIVAVPGSGPVRGVLEFGGAVYAWRDNVAGTAGVAHVATSDGWVAVVPGATVAFTDGEAVIAEGDTITGATSGATATVDRVVVQSGDFDAGDAAGYLLLSGATGAPFVAEIIEVDGNDAAILAGAAAPITFPPGGRYRFKVHNFYGGSGTMRAYGVNGVGDAFEFDGAVVAPIQTGGDAKPDRVAVFREHLFLARPGGGVDNSATGLPLSFDASLGAATIAVGSDVTDLLALPGGLAILAEQSVSVLTGTSKEDFQREVLTDSGGALPDTAQVIVSGAYVDNRGLRSLGATQTFAGFAMGTMSNDVKVTMARKKRAGVGTVASAVVRTKNSYRLFYADGSGIAFYMGRKVPEPMPFDLGFAVTCLSVTETESAEERIFVGADDGFVYQLDKGVSFDGEPFGAFIQTSYVHAGSPTTLKRWFKARYQLIAPPAVEVGLAIEYDYSNDEQPLTTAVTAQARGGGGLWGIADWGEFYWSAPLAGAVDFELDGVGRNASTIFYSEGANVGSYVLQSCLLDYAMRGQAR